MSRRLAAVMALTTVFLAAFTATAFAYVMNSGTFTLETTGVRFGNGEFAFYRYESKDFSYYGYLNDTAADGNGVFVHGKVAGYGYGPRLYSEGWKSQWLDDGAANMVSTANVEACVDRGTLYPDRCVERNFYNN